MLYGEQLKALTTEEQVMCLNVGYEFLDKINVVVSLGHTTLKGHCSYIHPPVHTVTENFLLALNGSEESRLFIENLCKEKAMENIFQARFTGIF